LARRDLPPLRALTAFEAAARHLSFKAAAAELHVTPAAIGHQIKSLEAHFGVLLFRRLNRRLLLTDAGQACLPHLRSGFDMLGKAAEVLRKEQAHNVLTVTVEPDFAAKWLVRRLERFSEIYPDIDVHLDATSRVVDLMREDVDVGLRYGGGGYTGLRVDKLFSHEVLPVCSPRLLHGEHPLRTLEDLRYHTLLHEDWETMDETWPTWQMWLRAAGLDIDTSRGPMFSNSSMALQAASEGHGVALAGSVLVADDIKAGRLVKPFDLTLSTPIEFAYYVVCAQSDEDRPHIKAFREWVLKEAQSLEPVGRPKY